MGSTQVPLRPQRVVVLDTAPLDSAIALGIKPVGAEFYVKPPTYLGDRIRGITVVGLNNSPNLETILSLNPDLILGTKIATERLYEQLAKIAPTVLTTGSGRSGEWKENFQTHATALGVAAKGQELMMAYDRRIATLKQKIAQLSTPPTISVVATGGGQIGAYTLKSFSGAILADLGLQRPPAQAKGDRWAIQVSREDLASIAGDAIFLIESNHIKDAFDLNQFTTDPMFSQLAAVKQQRVFAVNGEIWTAGRSILAAHRVLDDVNNAIDRCEYPSSVTLREA
jgi:iron complex transport system substrate-binding protein